MTAAPFATCVYAVIDPAGGASEIAQAGHLPPVLVLPGGATEVLDLPPGLPLGLGAGSFQVTQFSLTPGATLALYTDGLVESRTPAHRRGAGRAPRRAQLRAGPARQHAGRRLPDGNPAAVRAR